MKLNLLKFVYRGILTGMPLLTYNPITKNTINVPLQVKPYSTYINFKLDNEAISNLKSYINEYDKELELVPIKLIDNENLDYYLSINIYNCSSPAFLNDNKEVTRCEINTYVKDKNDNYGTLIIDYLSNELSMDPVNIFKNKEKVYFNNNDLYKVIDCQSENDKVLLKLNYTILYEYDININDDLIKYTDNVYYKNGIFDKVYYDSTLVNANVKSPRLYFNFSFIYKDLSFYEADSIFYFTNKINFIGGMWSNLYDI